MNSTIVTLLATPTKPFNNWPDKKLAAETKQVAQAMKKNLAFPKTEPPIATFSAAVDAFIDQLGKAGSRDINAVAAKNTKRFELVQLCNSLVNSVASTANGNREMLVSTGLPLRKIPQAVVLRNPENFTVTNGINPGELAATTDSGYTKPEFFTGLKTRNSTAAGSACGSCPNAGGSWRVFSVFENNRVGVAAFYLQVELAWVDAVSNSEVFRITQHHSLRNFP